MKFMLTETEKAIVRRRYARWRCARISEVLVSGCAQAAYFDGLFEEIADLFGYNGAYAGELVQ